MSTVTTVVHPVALPLRARRARELVPALLFAWTAGGFIAFFSVAVVVGAAGVEPMHGDARAAMLAIAVLVLLPALWASRRWVALRRPARLLVTGEALTVHFPNVLRDPLTVPRGSVRAASLDESRDLRFRVHATSGPYYGSDDDVWLWGNGSPLPVLTATGHPPNLALLFDPPVPVPRLTREAFDGPLRGERLAGLLLAVGDARVAERALDAVVPLRPLTMPDLFTLEACLGDPDGAPQSGARRALQRRFASRWGWLMAGGALVFPLLALGAAGFAMVLWSLGRRGQAVAMGAVGVIAATALVAARIG